MWTSYVQHTEYSNVINSISKEKSNNLRTQLGLYIDNNGLIRCKGRLDNKYLLLSKNMLLNIVKKSIKGPVKIFFGQSKVHVRY